MEISKQKEILNIICPLEKGYKTSKRELRLNFFENIQTEIQAYLLGFYVADGSINDKRHTLRVKVTESDIEIPKLFAEYICPNARQVINSEFKMIGPSGKEINVKSSAQVDITGKKIYEDLCALGFGSRKTYNENIHLPVLSDDLLWAFIRGYFDGDGCITGCVCKPNLKHRNKNPRFSFRVEWVAKHSSMLSDIQTFLEKYEIKGYIYFLKSSNAYRLNVSETASLKKLFYNLYKDSHFCLHRKYFKFNHYVNTETSQLIAERCNA